MSVTDGTGLTPKPMRYRRYSARVQLVPSGMGAQTSNRKARPSGAAMAARPMRLPDGVRRLSLGNYCLINATEAARWASRVGFYHKTTKTVIC